jgi:hypothetical protein
MSRKLKILLSYSISFGLFQRYSKPIRKTRSSPVSLRNMKDSLSMKQQTEKKKSDKRGNHMTITISNIYSHNSPAVGSIRFRF